MINTIKYNNQIACYKPSFFYIDLGQYNDMEDVINHNDKLSVLIHEYIHFMQDVLTVYGLNNIRNYYIIINNSIGSVKDQSCNKKIVPIDGKDDFINDFVKNFNLTYGSQDNFNLREYDKLINIKQNIINSNGSLPVPVFTAIYSHNKSIKLGAIHIFEGMSYLIEKILFDKMVIPSPDVPYSTIIQIVEYICPKLLVKKYFIVALCELSLSFSNPMQYFIESLDAIKGKSFDSLSLDEFVFLLTKDLMVGDENKTVSLNESFIEICNSARAKVNSILDMEYFDEAKLWINTILDKAVIQKEKTLIPITKTFITKDPFDAFKKSASVNLGCPAIYLQNIGITIEQENSTKDIYLFTVLNEVLNMLLCGQPCTLQKKCEQIEKSFKTPTCTNNLCETEPFKKINEENRCPYAIIWKYFGFGDNFRIM